MMTTNSMNNCPASAAQTPPKTNSAAKYAAIFGGAALTAGLAGAGLVHYETEIKPTKDILKDISGKTFQEKKQYIKSKQFVNNLSGVDMSKTTISKQLQKSLKPSALLKTLKIAAVPIALLTAAFTAIGYLKGHSAEKKAEENLKISANA